jgi:hypothetical protein
MKKRYLILALTGLLLTGCNHPTVSSSASSSASNSNATSSSTVSSSSAVVSSSATSSSNASSSNAPTSSSLSSEVTFYLQALEKKTDYYALSCSGSVKKGAATYQTSYASKSIDTTNQIEHVYERVVTLPGYSDNADTITKESDVYTSATALYTKAYDGKYHISDSARTDFAAYQLPFDFSKVSSPSVTYEDFDAHLNASVLSTDLSGFGETSLSGVTDFALVATLSKEEGILASFVFAYTQNGYAVTLSYKVSSLAVTLTLPTV